MVAQYQCRRALLRLWRRRAFSSEADGTGDAWRNVHSAVVLELLASSAAKRDEYLKLAQGVHTRQSLLRSYNIGIEADQRERDMNKRAARLVGLQMPDDGDGDDERGGSNNER